MASLRHRPTAELETPESEGKQLECGSCGRSWAERTRGAPAAKVPLRGVAGKIAHLGFRDVEGISGEVFSGLEA